MVDVTPYAFTVPQVADRWVCSVRHVYDLIASGQLGHIRVGNLIRVRAADIAAYEERQWHAPVSRDQTTGSSAVASTTMYDGGKTVAISAFQRGRQIAQRRRAT